MLTGRFQLELQKKLSRLNKHEKGKQNEQTLKELKSFSYGKYKDNSNVLAL